MGFGPALPRDEVALRDRALNASRTSYEPHPLSQGRGHEHERLELGGSERLWAGNPRSLCVALERPRPTRFSLGP